MWGWSGCAARPNALNMSVERRPTVHLEKLHSWLGLDLWRKNKPACWDAQHSNLSWNLSLRQTEQGIHNRNYHLSLRIAVKQALPKSLGWQNWDKTFNKHWNVLACFLSLQSRTAIHPRAQLDVDLDVRRSALCDCTLMQQACWKEMTATTSRWSGRDIRALSHEHRLIQPSLKRQRPSTRNGSSIFMYSLELPIHQTAAWWKTFNQGQKWFD